MRETQSSVAEWAESTFGPVPCHGIIAARANEEMAELLATVARGGSSLSILREAADVVIVLYRLAQYHGRDLLEEVDGKMALNRRREWNVQNGDGGHRR